MKLKVRCMDLYLYGEVHEILEIRDGAIYDTKSTGKYIHQGDESILPNNFKLSSCSTDLSNPKGKPKDAQGFEYVELEIYE